MDIINLKNEIFLLELEINNRFLKINQIIINYEKEEKNKELLEFPPGIEIEISKKSYLELENDKLKKSYDESENDKLKKKSYNESEWTVVKNKKNKKKIEIEIKIEIERNKSNIKL